MPLTILTDADETLVLKKKCLQCISKEQVAFSHLSLINISPVIIWSQTRLFLNASSDSTRLFISTSSRTAQR